LAWTVEFEAKADKQLDKLNRHDAARIISALEHIAALDDPRQRGHLLVGQFSGLWRYCVGDWRIVVRIEDDRLVVVVLTIAHRREVYR
jgi:mRNA interferase RelE/StbE